MPPHDPAARRRAQRGSGRQRGVWVYVPAETLTAMGYTAECPPYYRVWRAPDRPRLIVNLYPEP